MYEYFCGIDEAGRGPLAGPVAVGMCRVRSNIEVLSLFPEVRDSKKLSPKKREEIYKKLLETKEVETIVALIDAKHIDTYGIQHALTSGIEKVTSSLGANVYIQLDGGLRAPQQFHQETIIRGDQSIPLISLASIAAKVVRDEYMLHAAKKYPKYHFETHKGYGTKLHRAQIKAHGLSPIHRKTFCRNVLAEYGEGRKGGRHG